MEWIDYQASLCVGCSQPRHESFDRASDGRYDVERLVCHACAARDRQVNALEESERFGSFLSIKRDDE